MWEAWSVRLIGRRVNIKEVRITTDTLRPVAAVRSVPYADVYLKKLEIKGIHFKKQDSSTFIRAKALSLDLPHFFADVKACRQEPDFGRQGKRPFGRNDKPAFYPFGSRQNRFKTGRGIRQAVSGKGYGQLCTPGF